MRSNANSDHLSDEHLTRDIEL